MLYFILNNPYLSGKCHVFIVVIYPIPYIEIIHYQTI
jgi:hypothetical protein